MKKKLVSLLSLILVAVMVLPVMPTAVFADDPVPNPTITATYVDGSNGKVYPAGDYNSVKLVVSDAQNVSLINKYVEWTITSGDKLVSLTDKHMLDATFTATGADTGTVKIKATISYKEPISKTVDKEFSFKVNPLPGVSIAVPENLYEAGDNKTATLSFVGQLSGEEFTDVAWFTTSNDYFDLNSSTGAITAKKAGTHTVTASFKRNGVQDSLTADVTVKPYQIESIDVTNTKAYKEGDDIYESDFTVKATYTDGKTHTISTDKFALSADRAIHGTGNQMDITVTVDGTPAAENANKKTISITVAPFRLEDFIEEIVITAPTNNQEFEAGSELKKSDVEGYYVMRVSGSNTERVPFNLEDNTNIEISGTVNFVEGAYTIPSTVGAERTITVAYGGQTDTVTIKVKAKAPVETETTAPSTTPTTDNYFAVISGDYKKEYKVGEKPDISGLTIKLYKNTTQSNYKTIPGSQIQIADSAKFTSTGTISTYRIDFAYDAYNNDNVMENYYIELTNLTVKPATDSTRIREITSVTFNDDVNFIEGTEITLADIEKIKVKFIDNTTDTIYSSDFSDYTFTADLDLEVYTSEGARKTSSTYRDTIRPDDIYEDDDGDKVVNLALRYKYYTSTSSTASAKDGVYKIVAPITEADVAYYYKTTFITEYEDLEEALKYCNEQDDSIESEFDFSDVDEDDYLQLKLGKSFTLSSSYEFTPENNIVIDLNGRNLTLYSDTFEFDAYEDFIITVKNTAETEAKLTYKDKDITIVLKKGDSVSFDEDNTTPGIYTVTVKFDSTMGTVTASPAISSGKITAGKGTEIKFTITPKTGYDVDTVKADAKSVVTDKDNYSVNTTTGVATYTLESLTKDITFEATFKAQKKAWQNPFSDVKSTANYYSAVEFVYENELFKGTTGTTFSPNTTMTRAMFVTVLGRLAGIDEATAARKYGNDSDFTDVSASNGRISYAVPYIKWAVENGIVEGYGDGTFGPENEITHQQMYVMMYRYARFVENKGGSFSSVSLSMSDRSSVADWATDAVKYAQYNDYLVYTNNTKTLIDPTGDAKRSELAMLLEQFCATVLGWAAE